MASANQEENADDSVSESENRSTEDTSSQSYVESGEGNQEIENDNLEKMILSTGIRVGTPVKTKFMSPFIVRANPEGLYILDISKTLTRIDVAAKFIGRADISKIIVTSAREYGKHRCKSFVRRQELLGL